MEKMRYEIEIETELNYEDLKEYLYGSLDYKIVNIQDVRRAK